MFHDTCIVWAFFIFMINMFMDVAAKDNIRHQLTTDVSYQNSFLDPIQSKYKKSNAFINFRIVSSSNSHAEILQKSLQFRYLRKVVF